MARLDNAVGRYAYMTIGGIEYRTYFEEYGPPDGIPLICMHTAGADGRQWRHILEDAEVTESFRIIVPDLPFHGRSLPPIDSPWWSTEYKLTRDFFEKFVVTLSHELDLERPIFMGCSMAGHLAPDLAQHYPDEFRAVIGLEATITSQSDPDAVKMDRPPPTLADYYYNPRISNEFKGAHMVTICAPQSPETGRRETGWVYSQGAPAVFKGDLFYYFSDHDLSGQLANIDTSKVAVYVLCGDYDYSASPEDGQALADGIPGAKFTAMTELGHFPMSENYARFREYLLPVLQDIREFTSRS